MLLDCVHNYMAGAYRMLNLRTQFIVLSYDIMWINKTYCEYVSGQEHTKACSFILQHKYESNKWYHIWFDPFKT